MSPSSRRDPVSGWVSGAPAAPRLPRALVCGQLPSAHDKVLGRRVEQALQHEGLREERLDLLGAPLPRRELLHEQHQLLEVHLFQLRRPVDEEHGAHVDVEGGEALGGLRDVGVPEPDDARERELAHQQAVHPAEGELQEVEALDFEVPVELLVNPAHDVLQLQHHLLDPRLACRVVVLDVAQDLREAPVRAGLDRVEDGLSH
mmetsp:Transcript_125008/g.353844  ORF Transcript_125008/g.353844 Transcript_125008/m.353844 type:complete len:203 (+) Transcript_125008:23-631(+)